MPDKPFGAENYSVHFLLLTFLKASGTPWRHNKNKGESPWGRPVSNAAFAWFDSMFPCQL
jgi:hypothetical protein